jgi:GT2 family glycosyltransferase
MEAASPSVAVTAIVTAYRQADQAIATVGRILACRPRPAEILVHVDGNEQLVAERIRAAHPSIAVMISDTNVGPGGGRNIMMQRAAHAIVASFDDDSWPIDDGYFAEIADIFARHPDAAVVAATLVNRGETAPPAEDRAEWVADFCGGACAYRRQAFLDGGGYVALPTAYGMEEVDLAIRMRARGARILRAYTVRVFHDSDLSHHVTPRVTAASLANISLLAYLRYPIALWPIAAGQLLNRLAWLLTHGRSRGVLTGLLGTPRYVFRYRRARAVLPASVVLEYLTLRRHPQAIT